MSSSESSVLLLDRDDANARAVERGLAVAGFSVTRCADPARLPDLLKAGRFDVLIADVLMTRITDEDLIVWARQNQRKLRIVIMSEFESPFLDKQCISKGADLFVAKPVDLHKLQEFLLPVEDRTSGGLRQSLAGGSEGIAPMSGATVKIAIQRTRPSPGPRGRGERGTG